jgi:hypothetical protein
MRSIHLVIFLFILNMNSNAQKAAGTYSLRGVMEMAAGFNLLEDSSFEFFMSYGALDRTGKGKWTQQGNLVTFNAELSSRPHFSLVKSSKSSDSSIQIIISDPSPILSSAVYVVLVNGNSETEPINDQKGIIRFPLQAADSVKLLFEFAPEKVALFPLRLSDHNVYEFRFEPWVFDVEFRNQQFELTDEGLDGSLPFLKPGNYHFKRNKH